MIEITKAYKTEDGLTFGSIPEAQQHELERMCGSSETAAQAIQIILGNVDKVIAILKLKPRKPRTVKAKKQKLAKVE